MSNQSQSDHQDSMELRLQQIETRLDTLDQGQDRSNNRLDALDRGQAAMIRRMDAQDIERADLRTEITANTEITRETLDATREGNRATLEATKDVRALAENMQSAGRFFNKVYDGFAWVVRTVSSTSKILWPIAALLVLLWGALYAYTHGGKPPSVGSVDSPQVAIVRKA